MSSIRDDHHILFEFDDPERRRLIEYLAARYPKYIGVKRQNFFALWFADIEVLRFLADPGADREKDLKARVRNFPTLDIPSLLAGGLQVPVTVVIEGENADEEPNRGDSDESLVQDVSGAGTWESDLPLVGGKRKPSGMASPESASGRKACLLRHSSFRLCMSRDVPLGKPAIGDGIRLGWLRGSRRGSENTFDRPNILASAQKSNKQRPTLNQVSPAVAVRDEKRCQITRGGEMGCEVAHILDGNALTWDDLMEIWDWLEAFWGTEKVAKWKGLISEDWELCVHQVHNLITLDMKIHHFWDHGLVALRPIWINEEQTEMKISFHLLPLEELKGSPQKETVWMTAYPLKDPKFRPKNTSGGH